MMQRSIAKPILFSIIEWKMSGNICLFREIPFVTWNGKTVLCKRATEKMISCQHAEHNLSVTSVGGQRFDPDLAEETNPPVHVKHWIIGAALRFKEKKHVNTDATYNRRFPWFKIAPVHWCREPDVLLKSVCVCAEDKWSVWSHTILMITFPGW